VIDTWELNGKVFPAHLPDTLKVIKSADGLFTAAFFSESSEEFRD